MPDNFVCGKCGKVAKTKQALERHAAYHEDDRPFSCEVCLQRFKNSDDRGKHYRRLKRDGKFSIACTVCHKHFKTEEILQKHIEMLGCNVAAAQDRDKGVTAKSSEGSAITLREDNVLGECITCTCKVCETVFSSTSFLKKHYKEVHNDNKRQVCIQCGQTLSSKDSLARHFSIFHQSSFPYACDQCDQKFKIKESLCRHVKFVHQDGGYQCHECHRVFSQPVNLRKHLAVHSTQKEFSCQSCGREFRWKQALQKHELLHETQATSDAVKDESGRFMKSTAEMHEQIGDEGNEENDDDEFNDIHNENAHDKISSLSRPVNHKLRYTASIEKSHKVSLSGKSVLGNDYTVKRKNEFKLGDDYDFPDDDDDDDDNVDDDVVSESNINECGKRMKFSKCVIHNESKKPKIVENTILTDKLLSEVIDAEKDMKEDNVSGESGENDDTVVTLVQNVENHFDTPDNRDESVKDDSGYSTESKDTRDDNEGTVRNIEKRKRESEQNEVNIDNDVGLKKLKFSALTSFPTIKTKDAPRFLFKPSSIQTIMSGPSKVQTADSSSSDDKSDEDRPANNRSLGFKLPSAFGSSAYTKLHNPFIIPNISLRKAQESENKKDDGYNKNVAVNKNLQGLSKILSAPKEQIIPSGKFSLVKHMLSLQNEDNFDKTIFENPLYNKPADVKDFEHMIERHRVIDKTDDTIVQSYDLSAKQNIPFHWLGLSVARRKVSIERAEKKKGAISPERHEQSLTVIEEGLKQAEVDKSSVDSSINDAVKENFGEVYVENKNDDIRDLQKVQEVAQKTNPCNDQTNVSRGYQAMRNLVANRQLVAKTEGQLHWNLGKSVLTNPFDYENRYFQDNHGDHLSNKSAVSSLKVLNSSDSRNNTKTSIGISNTAQSDNPLFHRNSDHNDDFSHMNNGTFHVQTQFVRQHSLGTHTESSTSSSFLNTKHNIPSHSRTFSESHLTPETVASQCPFSRSLSIPFTPNVSNAIQQQRMWGSESCIASNNITPNMAETVSTSSDTSTVQRQSEKCMQTLSGETKYKSGLNTNLDSLVNESMIEIASGITSEKRIDLTMISKNLAQLHKLHEGKLDKNEIKLVSKHHNSLQDICTSDTRPLKQRLNNIDSLHLKSGQIGGSSEDDVFDAYSMVHSPYRTDFLHSVDGDGPSLGINLQNNSKSAGQSSYIGGKSDAVEKLRLSVNNRTGQVEKCVVNDLDRVKQTDNVKSRYSQEEHESKSEVSIFDILKGHEDRGKEYDNFDALLGAYI